MSDLTIDEAIAVFSALDPAFKPDARGCYRGPASYRGGNNPTALHIDTSKGGRFYDHVRAEGGDVIDYVRAQLHTDFNGACRTIAAITGRQVGSVPPRQRYSAETLMNARYFRTGILWRIDRHLELLKEELWGPKQAQVAPAVHTLTQWRSRIAKWSDYKAAGLMIRLSRRIPDVVSAAVAEASAAERELLKRAAMSATA